MYLDYTPPMRFLLLLLLLALAPAAPAADRATAREHVQRGIALYDAGKPQQAAAEFRHAIAADPAWSLPHYELALALWTLKDLPTARAAAEESIRLEPSCWDCHSLLGSILDDAGEHQRAYELFQKAAQLAPAEGRPHYDMAIASLRLKQQDRAIAHLRDAQRIKPSYPTPYWVLGILYFEQGKLFLADEQLRQFIKLETSGRRYEAAKQLTDRQITIDTSGQKEDDATADAMSYCIVRAADMLPDEYRKRRPGAETYAADLADDAEVFSTWAQIISEGKRVAKSPFGFLVRVRDGGYMKPYLLVAFPDRYAADRSAFDTANPGKLAEFRAWAAGNAIPLTPPRPGCTVRWMDRSW